MIVTTNTRIISANTATMKRIAWLYITAVVMKLLLQSLVAVVLLFCFLLLVVVVLFSLFHKVTCRRDPPPKQGGERFKGEFAGGKVVGFICGKIIVGRCLVPRKEVSL